MKSIQSIIEEEYQDDLSSMNKWADDMYNSRFASSFEGIQDLYKRLQSKSHPITDEELEWSLTLLPMEMFNVSEALNSFRLDYEVIKLKNKEKRRELLNAQDPKLSATAKSENVAGQMIEYEIVSVAYSSIITRVENEISFSREFIMGAKKVWDARRRTESANPVKEIPEPPEYKIPGHIPTKHYVQ